MVIKRILCIKVPETIDGDMGKFIQPGIYFILKIFYLDNFSCVFFQINDQVIDVMKLIFLDRDLFPKIFCHKSTYNGKKKHKEFKEIV